MDFLPSKLKGEAGTGLCGGMGWVSSPQGLWVCDWGLAGHSRGAGMACQPRRRVRG